MGPGVDVGYPLQNMNRKVSQVVSLGDSAEGTMTRSIELVLDLGTSLATSVNLVLGMEDSSSFEPFFSLLEGTEQVA